MKTLTNSSTPNFSSLSAEKPKELSDFDKQRIMNLNYIVWSASFLGTVGGIIYANKTGGKFWRYVGYAIVGGALVSFPTKLITIPFKNKILKEAEKK